MRLDRGPGRVLKLVVTALATQVLAARVSENLVFPVVFAAVYAADQFVAASPGRRQVYLEEVVSGLAFYALLGLLAQWADTQLSLYTGRHAGPLVPAIALAVFDRALFRSPSDFRGGDVP